jgi:prepilin-type N-terminal cleavage/methylation domain-containing protein
MHKGFTLLEAAMVVVLLGVLFAFAWPDFNSARQTEHLRQSAERLRSLVALCRAEAMNQTACYRIRIRGDGSVRVLRQADPLKAPHLYIRPRVDWAQTSFLLDDVWIEAIQMLPAGPPPIRIINERLEFPETQIEPVPIGEARAPLDIDFDPEGTLNYSLRCVLRDTRGMALLWTLDGRFGSVTIEDWNSVPADQVQRPEPLPEDEEPAYRPEDYQ